MSGSGKNKWLLDKLDNGLKDVFSNYYKLGWKGQDENKSLSISEILYVQLCHVLSMQNHSYENELHL